MASEKGKEVVQEGASASKRRKAPLGHFHDDVSPTHFCKVIRAPGLDLLPIPPAFRHHIGAIPKEIVLKTNTGYNWVVTVVDHNGSAAIDNGWAPFAMCHNIKAGHFINFKMLKPTVYRVTIFNTDGTGIVKRCDQYPMNLVLKSPIQNA